MMVKVTKFVISRPIYVFFFLVFLVIVLGSIPITIWHRSTKNITNDVGLYTEDLQSSLTNSVTIGLARVIDSYLTNNITNFTEIQTQIAPMLFRAYSMIPQVSQVSYISTDGLLFSYITELSTSVAVFANSSLNLNVGGNYTWYTQTVDQITGNLNGNATKYQPLDVTHTDWFQAAHENFTSAFVGIGLGGGGGEDKETLFQRVASLSNKKGFVLLGFLVKTLTGVLNRLNLHGGEFYMWNKDGTFLVHQGSLNASFFISNGSTCFDKKSKSFQPQCIPANCSSHGCLVEIERSKFEAFSSVLEVSGVPLRFTLMFPKNGGGPSNIKNASMYLLIVTMFLGLCWPLGFVALMLQAARREMHMRTTLINQFEATQQAERKSMNKSQVFARASHDIRGSLAGITGLIDLCREEVKPSSEIDTSLKQVNVWAKDLVALLNSVLDMSKIESGKMHLEEEEFNLAKLLEEVIDVFHPLAMKKGVGVVLDMHDGSVFESPNVRGDSGKLKQILNNLVSNASTATYRSELGLIGLVPRALWSWQQTLKENKDKSSSYEIDILKNNANMMEFVFEVEDTCKGIPVEMRKSVRETAQGQQGTGLGLGIVQSLVRLMGGEIRITDKDMGEKETCFQFNVLLKTSESTVSDMKGRQDIETGGDHVSTPNLGLAIKTSLGGNMNIWNMSPRFNNWLSSSPKQKRSRVVLLLKDEERRRVTENYIKSLGIKVTVVERWEHLNHTLERFSRVSPQGSMGRAECISRNESHILKRRSNSFSAVFLLVIDAKTGPFSELYDIVEHFRRGFQNGTSCKVVWLNEQSGQGSERGDISCSKPLHGSRLNRVLKILPEFGETEPKEDEFLSGKRVLVVDDNLVTSSVAARKLKKTGVCEVKQCDSGKEAVRLVSEWLTQREQQGSSTETLPFDYIFMDCQMLEMDGYEATREITKVERGYGVHIPIIAVSGHDPGSKEARETIKAGMDVFLEKNLNQDQLVKVIREIKSKVCYKQL
ncbi:unnamed protein product, partial [Thlaspi arvense]